MESAFFYSRGGYVKSDSFGGSIVSGTVADSCLLCSFDSRKGRAGTSGSLLLADGWLIVLNHTAYTAANARDNNDYKNSGNFLERYRVCQNSEQEDVEDYLIATISKSRSNTRPQTSTIPQKKLEAERNTLLVLT